MKIRHILTVLEIFCVRVNFFTSQHLHMTVRVTVSTLPPPTVLTHDSQGDCVHPPSTHSTYAWQSGWQCPPSLHPQYLHMTVRVTVSALPPPTVLTHDSQGDVSTLPPPTVLTHDGQGDCVHPPSTHSTYTWRSGWPCPPSLPPTVLTHDSQGDRVCPPPPTVLTHDSQGDRVHPPSTHSTVHMTVRVTCPASLHPQYLHMTVSLTVSTLLPPTVLTHDSEGDHVHPPSTHSTYTWRSGWPSPPSLHPQYLNMTVRVTVSTLPPPTVLTHDSQGDCLHPPSTHSTYTWQSGWPCPPPSHPERRSSPWHW